MVSIPPSAVVEMADVHRDVIRHEQENPQNGRELRRDGHNNHRVQGGQ